MRIMLSIFSGRARRSALAGLLFWLTAGLGAVQAASSAGAVDLNRATTAELMRVPGMTASWAGRIVRFRPYRTKLDLVQEGVLTPEAYQRIRDGVIAHRAPSAGGKAASPLKP